MSNRTMIGYCVILRKEILLLLFPICTRIFQEIKSTSKFETNVLILLFVEIASVLKLIDVVRPRAYLDDRPHFVYLRTAIGPRMLPRDATLTDVVLEYEATKADIRRERLDFFTHRDGDRSHRPISIPRA